MNNTMWLQLPDLGRHGSMMLRAEDFTTEAE